MKRTRYKMENKGLRFSDVIYGKNDYVDYMIYLFIATAQKDFPEEIDVPNHAWDEYIDELYKYTGQNFIPKKNHTNCIRHTDIKKNDKRVVVGFSGGRDSTATCLYYKLTGREVDLFHVKGMSRAYRHEDVASMEVAEYLGLNLIDVDVKMSGRVRVSESGSTETDTDFVRNESPVRNEFVLALMIEYMMDEGITDCALGIFADEFLGEISSNYGLSDAYDFNKSFEKAVQYTFPEFRFHTVLRNKVHSLAYILQHDKGLVELYQSCMTRDMYRNKLRTIAENKYGIVIPKNKCLSCYKCCAEFLIMHSLGYITLDKDIIFNKIIPVLKKNVHHQADMSAEKIKSLTLKEVLKLYMDVSLVDRYKKNLSLIDKDVYEM